MMIENNSSTRYRALAMGTIQMQGDTMEAYRPCIIAYIIGCLFPNYIIIFIVEIYSIAPFRFWFLCLQGTPGGLESIKESQLHKRADSAMFVHAHSWQHTLQYIHIPSCRQHNFTVWLFKL